MRNTNILAIISLLFSIGYAEKCYADSTHEIYSCLDSVADGDEIILLDGSYDVNIEINKSITLKSFSEDADAVSLISAVDENSCMQQNIDQCKSVILNMFSINSDAKS